MTLAAVIEELAKLMAEEERVEVRIRETQAALSDVKKRISESLMRRHLAMTEEKVSMPEDLLKEEQSYEHLGKALLGIKQQIAKEIRAMEERVVQAYCDQLKQSFHDERDMLAECLASIDRRLLDCHVQLEEYERVRSALHSLNERLCRLGNEPFPVPDPLPVSDIADLVTARINQLKSQGKL